MNWRLLVGGGIPLAMLVGLLAWPIIKKVDPHALPSAMEGKPAPAFSLTSLEGETVQLADFAGRPVVLNFWATWCRPCAQEHPFLLSAAREYEERVVFLGVLYGDTEDKASTYLEQVGSAYPTLMDPGQRTAMDFGVGGVPETFFISSDGVIAKKVALPLNGAELRSHLEPLL